ncbi:MAG: hypothetical protein FWG69_00800 [Oscillospiraceae bacterium]|nr:hypothetical protein [Oscillospiraceae bacterium]
MTKNKKRGSALVLVFMLVIIMGVVYAAASGTLTFNGTATMGADCELWILPEIAQPELPNGSEGTMVVNSGGQSATITVDLKEPGDTLTFQFSVQNSGARDAKITAATLNTGISNPDLALAVGGTYTDLANHTIATGQTVTGYTITVGWSDNEAFEDIDSGTYTFTIELPYEMTITG